MIDAISDLIRLVDDYCAWLGMHGCRFDDDGFPLLEKSHFLDEWPNQIVTFRERNAQFVKDKSKAVLCFYCEDGRIFPRMEKLFDELDEYQQYMGVIGADVTVTADMDIEWQEETILLNQLFMAVLALSGVKVVQNLRIGSQSTLRCLRTVPRGIMCASGTLGCARTSTPYDLRYSEKIFTLRPSRVLVYGKSDPVMEAQLDCAGVPHRLYRDTHTIRKTMAR